MATAKHFPGPWSISDLGPIDGEEDITIEKDGCPLCTVRGTNDMSCVDEEDLPQLNAEVIANAKLIAAAPDLLEALVKLYMAVYGGNSVSVEDAINRSVKTDEFEMSIVSAIKKATE